MLFKKGDEGLRVQRIKQRLLDLGFLDDYQDAKFDDAMHNAVVAFQAKKGLTQDGKIGSITNSFLYPELVNPKLISNSGDSVIPDFLDIDGDGIPEFTKASINLIIRHEVGGGEKYYNKFLSRPSYPGGASGPTLMIGVDIGYTTFAEFEDDFSQVDKSIKDRLKPGIGLKGEAADRFVDTVKDITISWDIAISVFMKKTLLKEWNKTKKAFPGIESLNSDTKGALTSLVYNRGPLIDSSDKRKEMKTIRDICIPQKDYNCIANQFRSMKRLWSGKGLDGLLLRREDEARLIENSING